MHVSEVFMGIAVISLVLFILHIIMSAVFGDDGQPGTGGRPEAVDKDGRAGAEPKHVLWFLQGLSIRNAAFFAMGYGLTGYAAVRSGLSGWTSQLPAAAGGCLLVFALGWLTRAFHNSGKQTHRHGLYGHR